MNFCNKVVLVTGASSDIGSAKAKLFAKLGAELIKKVPFESLSRDSLKFGPDKKILISKRNINPNKFERLGIGSATAKLFAKLGATLVITGRNEQNLKELAKACSELSGGQKPFVIAGELTNESDTKNIMDTTIKSCNKLDVLINSAGVIEMGTIENTSLEQYDRVMNINMRSIYHLTMLAIPHLIKSEGNIVNVSSVNGIRSFPGVLAYNLSKAAVDQFTRCVALEMAPKKVRVNSVNPGVVVTNLHKRMGMNDEVYSKFLERTKETHALGRPGQPEEVANAICFLASDLATFTTGCSLPVDGGRHAMCPR